MGELKQIGIIKKSKGTRYFALTSLDGRDELYRFTESKVKEFEKKFGNIDSPFELNNHNDALDWVRANCKFISYCSCLAYE